jgi:hypothetical protein
MLYEIRPDVVAGPPLTDTELCLWGLFFEDRNERHDAARQR